MLVYVRADVQAFYSCSPYAGADDRHGGECFDCKGQRAGQAGRAGGDYAAQDRGRQLLTHFGCFGRLQSTQAMRGLTRWGCIYSGCFCVLWIGTGCNVYGHDKLGLRTVHTPSRKCGRAGQPLLSSQSACVCVPVRRPLQHAQVWGCPGQPAPWLQKAYPGLGKQAREESSSHKQSRDEA